LFMFRKKGTKRAGVGDPRGGVRLKVVRKIAMLIERWSAARGGDAAACCNRIGQSNILETKEKSIPAQNRLLGEGERCKGELSRHSPLFVKTLIAGGS